MYVNSSSGVSKASEWSRNVYEYRDGIGKKSVHMLRLMIILGAVFICATAFSAEFSTPDPLKAFVRGEYPLGDDYFIAGVNDTVIFRCVLTKAQRQFEGVAFSEISIWGNRSGPWEVFRKNADDSFSYVETAQFGDTACLESCRSAEYNLSGVCRWVPGWPIQSKTP